MTLYLTGDADADRLLEDDPFALLVGMVLDQQVPMERAFSAPKELRDRLGGKLDVGQIAAMAPDELAAAFSAKPALHRFPAAMAERVQAVARILVERYGGDAAAVWASAADGAELLANLRSLPGFGEQKAKIFLALLAKRLGVRPRGWQRAAGPYGEKGSFVSVADIDSVEALNRVREHKRQMKAAAKAAAGVDAPPPERRAGAAAPAAGRSKRR
ncbi:MAG TPA: HhH-GPD-type base excision DNA repair protein [Acidimicrobiales bacterium]|nr:HhH-GPD-type base excision DNA repair protein [Acidimicrobiales bacterium]